MLKRPLRNRCLADGSWLTSKSCSSVAATGIRQVGHDTCVLTGGIRATFQVTGRLGVRRKPDQESGARVARAGKDNDTGFQRGREKENVVPAPGADSTLICPPCASTTALAR